MKKLFLLTLSLVLISSCKEEPPEVPPKPFDNRDAKVGVYRVTNDTLSYDIVVEKFDSLGVQPSSFLRIRNLLDLFPEVLNRVSYPDKPSNDIVITPYYPHFDKHGKRWAIYYQHHPDSSSDFNIIRNDTLRLYFQLTNIKYRVQDSVPYVNEYVAIEGIRIK